MEFHLDSKYALYPSKLPSPGQWGHTMKTFKCSGKESPSFHIHLNLIQERLPYLSALYRSFLQDSELSHADIILIKTTHLPFYFDDKVLEALVQWIYGGSPESSLFLCNPSIAYWREIATYMGSLPLARDLAFAQLKMGAIETFRPVWISIYRFYMVILQSIILAITIMALFDITFYLVKSLYYGIPNTVSTIFGFIDLFRIDDQTVAKLIHIIERSIEIISTPFHWMIDWVESVVLFPCTTPFEIVLSLFKK